MDPCYSQLSEFCSACKGNLDLASLNKIMTGWTNPFNVCQKKKKWQAKRWKVAISFWQNAQTSLAFSLQWSRVCLRYSSCLMLSMVITWLITLLGFPLEVKWERRYSSCHRGWYVIWGALSQLGMLFEANSKVHSDCLRGPPRKGIA